MKAKLLFLFLPFLFTACALDKIKSEAEAQFSDQYFKTAIALIELHRIRTGEYPESLQDIEFSGDWDQSMYTFVLYKKLNDGYELDLVQDYHDITYPKKFWNGLGLKRTNIKR